MVDVNPRPRHTNYLIANLFATCYHEGMQNQLLLHEFQSRLFGSESLKPAAELLDAGKDIVLAVPLGARAAFVAACFAHFAKNRCSQPILMVMAGEEAALRTARHLAHWLGNNNVYHFPMRTETPWGKLPINLNHVGLRNLALWRLCSTETSSPVVVVASVRSLMRSVPVRTKTPAFTPIHFVCGEKLGAGLSYSKLAQYLISMGYERVKKLGAPGEFIFHGDTLDIFGVGSPYPVRIELFDDEVEVIRRIVLSTSQTICELPRTEIFAAREFIPDSISVANLQDKVHAASDINIFPKDIKQHLEYFNQGINFRESELYLEHLFEHIGSPLSWLPENALVILEEPRAIFDDATHYYEEVSLSAHEHGISDCARGRLYLPPAALDFGEQQRITLSSLMTKGVGVDGRIEAKHVDTSASDEKLVAAVRACLSAKNLTIVCEPDSRVRDTLALSLSDAHITFQNIPAADFTFRHDRAWLTDLDIPSSLVIPQAKLAFLTIADISSKQAVRQARTRRSIDITQVTFPFKPGDYVVHETHGIALFREIVRQEIDGIQRDYLFLEYAKGDKLFTPIDAISKITRFVGPEGTAPRLTRLNTSDWSRATGKARKAAKRLAFDLVDLYSRRATATGFAFALDDAIQYEMEMLFPYEETSDQLQAIADVKADMQSERPMDRLICGDVGFGKTEVALRAAFKAVQSGKQVMLLCPTTILAQQHFTTFSERFEPFAVRVDVLSRFRSAAEQKITLKDVANGKVDVLIGTHRLLSSDVNPKNLGLIIIDEEQRFGVQHKEQIKNLREQLDVLTLSATPIPRTLQIALSGVRDLSIIDTPPQSRTPVKVHVGEWDADVVSTAIRRELARNGQVYYVSNRVRSIDDAVKRVYAAAPEARVAVAHGQMGEHALEAVMERFAANEADVLIATTIIESGLDNPHSNTLIIEDSQRLGLAQLYQLKGRVGRSHTQAFAYFLFPSHEALTETAIDRLTAIGEYHELGSGMRIAMRDLEIRGAGSLLGAEQSGMLTAVGFDLFASMIQEAVENARSLPSVAFPEVRIDLPAHFYLPEEYIAAADERVVAYRRIAAISTISDFEALKERLVCDYGALPAPAQNLLDRAKAKILAAQLGASGILVLHGKLVIDEIVLTECQHKWVKQQQGALYFATSHRLQWPLPKDLVGRQKSDTDAKDSFFVEKKSAACNSDAKRSSAPGDLNDTSLLTIVCDLLQQLIELQTNTILGTAQGTDAMSNEQAEIGVGES
ncbi:MAG: transcription-repair coupling factor [Coriobacteriales bacterium]|jgi:transcription-repair coupling factor (superfamily II helicase)|nr:transcription-repair coupling factor [Coriobacteriales bacterium]